jgi:hypothetical protein
MKTGGWEEANKTEALPLTFSVLNYHHPRIIHNIPEQRCGSLNTAGGSPDNQFN